MKRIKNANEFGNHIDMKHKGETGKSIPWKQLH